MSVRERQTDWREAGNGASSGRPRWRADWLVMTVATVIGMLVGPGEAYAATFRLRTYTVGRATQTYRPDRSASARRIFTQGVDLRAYNLLDDEFGRLRAVLNARYTTDFTVPRRRRDDPIYADQWNDTALRLAYLDWAPTQRLEIRAGRQWSQGTLGTRDFDGLRIRARPKLDRATDGLVAVYAGRDVMVEDSPINTADFDVQGLPATNDEDFAPRTPAPDASPWVAGGRLGLDWGDLGSVTFAYRRRWRTLRPGSGSSAESRLGSERVGLAASASPTPRLALSSAAVYHATLEGVDRASLDLAWDVPDPAGTLSLGIEHRRPWFDASSIFNLFGARPHQGGYLVYRQGVDALETEFELRHWSRIYRGSVRSTGFEPGGRDTMRLGVAAAHTSDLRPFGRRVDWRSQVSFETDPTGREGHHFLADTHLRMPVWLDDFYVTGRLLFLAVANPRSFRTSGTALTYVLGVEVPLADFGTFHLVAERTDATFSRPNTELFGNLELEIWQ